MKKKEKEDQNGEERPRIYTILTRQMRGLCACLSCKMCKFHPFRPTHHPPLPRYPRVTDQGGAEMLNLGPLLSFPVQVVQFRQAVKFNRTVKWEIASRSAFERPELRPNPPKLPRIYLAS